MPSPACGNCRNWWVIEPDYPLPKPKKQFGAPRMPRMGACSNREGLVTSRYGCCGEWAE